MVGRTFTVLLARTPIWSCVHVRVLSFSRRPSSFAHIPTLPCCLASLHCPHHHLMSPHRHTPHTHTFTHTRIRITAHSAKALSKYTDMVDSVSRELLNKLAEATDAARLALKQVCVCACVCRQQGDDVWYIHTVCVWTRRIAWVEMRTPQALGMK